MSAVIIIVFFLVCIFSALTAANSNNLFEAMVSGGKKLYAGVKWFIKAGYETTLSGAKKIYITLKKSRHELWELIKFPEVQDNHEPSKEGICQTKDDDPWQ